MKESDIYTSGYDFAARQSRNKKKTIIIVSVIFVCSIIFFFLFGVLKNIELPFNQTQKVDKLFNIDDTNAKKGEDYTKEVELYKNVNIPYDDPENRFSIVFMTPFVSGDIGVVIYNEKDYDTTKAEADKVIEAAKKRVPVTSVSYLNSFKQ